MIDIHSHIIFGVDDGAKTIEASREMLKAAKASGVDTIISTPHYIRDKYHMDNLTRYFKQTSEIASDLGIGLLEGYEVKLDLTLVEDIKENRKITLNSSKYLLIELPFDEIPFYAKDTLYMLTMLGIKPIIAHPERNKSFVEDYKLFRDYVEMGYPMQLDAASITGTYGFKIKHFSKKALKDKYIKFIASDAHNPRGYSDWYINAFRKVKKWVGEEETYRLFYSNAEEMIFI